MKKIILSRTDSIGDVVLTLPVAGILKERFPDLHIIFLGKEYTRPVIELCKNIDQFLDWDKIKGPGAAKILRETEADSIIHIFPVKEICNAAKKAGIPIRIATAGRFFTWTSCNRLVKISRKNSDLHEAQLNVKLLKSLGIHDIPSLDKIQDYYGLNAEKLPPSSFINKNRKFNLILHPKSKGSAREWGLDNYQRLIDILSPEKYNIYITGTLAERSMMQEFLEHNRDTATDLTGKMTLPEYISFINDCDGLVAASTGPLHIAAALGKKAIGIYAPMRPIWPRRWAPLGKHAGFLVREKNCNDCRKNGDCHCIREIRAEEVLEMIERA